MRRWRFRTHWLRRPSFAVPRPRVAEHLAGWLGPATDQHHAVRRGIEGNRVPASTRRARRVGRAPGASVPFPDAGRRSVDDRNHQHGPLGIEGGPGRSGQDRAVLIHGRPGSARPAPQDQAAGHVHLTPLEAEEQQSPVPLVLNEPMAEHHRCLRPTRPALPVVEPGVVERIVDRRRPRTRPDAAHEDNPPVRRVVFQRMSAPRPRSIRRRRHRMPASAVPLPGIARVGPRPAVDLTRATEHHKAIAIGVERDGFEMRSGRRHVLPGRAQTRDHHGDRDSGGKTLSTHRHGLAR